MTKKSANKNHSIAATLRTNAVNSVGTTTGGERVTLSAIFAVAPGEVARAGGPCKIQYSLDDSTSPRGFWEEQGYEEFYGYVEADVGGLEYEAAVKTTTAVLCERFGTDRVVIV